MQGRSTGAAGRAPLTDHLHAVTLRTPAAALHAFSHSASRQGVRRRQAADGGAMPLLWNAWRARVFKLQTRASALPHLAPLPLLPPASALFAPQTARTLFSAAALRHYATPGAPLRRASAAGDKFCGCSFLRQLGSPPAYPRRAPSMRPAWPTLVRRNLRNVLDGTVCLRLKPLRVRYWTRTCACQRGSRQENARALLPPPP